MASLNNVENKPKAISALTRPDFQSIRQLSKPFPNKGLTKIISMFSKAKHRYL